MQNLMTEPIAEFAVLSFGEGNLADNAMERDFHSTKTVATRLNQADRDLLITSHMDLVGYVVRSVQTSLPAQVDREELESAGYLGLIDAAAKFDVSKHVQFRSYAQFRIRGAVLDSLRMTDWSPRALRRKGREIEQAMQDASQRNGGVATEAEIANELGVSVSEYQHTLGELHSLEIGSLHVGRPGESEENELDYVPGSVKEEPLFRCLEGELQQHLADAIDALPERERLVLTLSYFEEMTLKEIAGVLGVVESRVSQLRSGAVLRLRAALSALAPVENQVGRCEIRLTSAA